MNTPSTPTQNPPTQNATRFVGVDVHKETLYFDADNLFRGEIQNQGKDILQTLQKLQTKAGANTPLHVCCEATGTYTRPLAGACWQLELPISMANPARVRKYAEGMGVLGKTDKADARVIRLYAEEAARQAETANAVPLRPHTPPDPVRDKLRQTHDLRDLCVEHRTRLSNALAAITLPEFQRDIQIQLRALDARIEKLEALLAETVREAGPAFAGLVKAVDGIKGVGFLTATKLVALCPELGTLTRRGSASLAGLAPYPKDSGNVSGPRQIRGGRKPLRNALYMAAGVAARHNDVLKEFYQRLREAGKHHNVAVTAVMRKLFYYANVVAAEHQRSLAAPVPETPPTSPSGATAD